MSHVFTGSIACSAKRRYLSYPDADFEVFRSAGATHCTNGDKIWHGGGDPSSAPPCQISPPSVQRQGCRTPRRKIFTQIWPKLWNISGRIPCVIVTKSAEFVPVSGCV